MATARYDDASAFYAAGWDDACADPATSALLSLAGSPAGDTVVDIACGHGRVARELARRGANVLGVDIAGSLLERAREIERGRPLRVRYELVDVTTEPLPRELGPFDLATCNFGLSDIDDLKPAVATVRDALRPGGTFVWSILHPCFPGGGEVSGSWPPDRRYGDEGYWVPTGRESSLRGRVGANHRTLSTYLNTMIRNGFVVSHVAEPDPGPGWDGPRSSAGRHPVYLVVRSVRQ